MKLDDSLTHSLLEVAEEFVKYYEDLLGRKTTTNLINQSIMTAGKRLTNQ